MFYLLWAEWYFEQRLLDSRAWKFIVTQYTKPPERGEVFPWLAEEQQISDDIDLDADEMVFHAITSQLAAKTHA